MNGGFTSLIGRSDEISQQLQHLQLSLDIQPREPDVSHDDLLKWINAVSTRDDYDVALQAKVENTCNWALDMPEFQTWLASDPLSKAAKVLWIKGKPGTGKSILTASLVEYLKKHQSAPVCYFFCFYNHDGKRRCNNIVGSWVSQLVKPTNAIAFQIAKEVYKKKESHIAAQVELWRIFQEAISQLQECFFVIDGFDECVREDALARNFSDLNTRALFLQQLDGAISNTQARVLIVSREDADIRERLRLSLDRNAAGSNCNVWTEYEITLDDTEKDIERFSRYTLEHKLSSSRTTAELKEELAADAAQKSEGMFLWIKLLYARLSRSNSPSRLRSIISSTPSGLDQAYERDLKAILSFREEDQIRAIAILRWTLFVERPLTVRELCEALIVERDLGDEYQESDTDSLKSDDGFLDQADIPEVWDNIYVEDQILKLCGSLIVVRGEDVDQPIEDHAIYFVHFSVKEYLLKVDPFVSTSRAHTRIAMTCLKYLCYDNFYQEQNSTLEEIEYKMKRYAFLSYAAFHGLDHLDSCPPVAPELIQWCNHLLDPKAFKWLSFSEVLCSDEFESYKNYITEHRDNFHSPLYLASRYGQTETIQWLIVKEEDVKHVGGWYGCPLSTAAGHGHQDAVKLLLASGADPNQSGGMFGNPLQSAAAEGHESIVTTLLASGALVNQIGGLWHTPIIAASQVPDPKISKAIVCRLLQAGADVKITSRDGTTALHEASKLGFTEVIGCLFESGAEINAQTDDGKTPLYFACYHSNEEAIRALIDKDADVNAVSETGRSPLHVTAEDGNDAVVNLLLDHHADVKARENNGFTALHIAARMGDVSTIEILLQHGADVDARDNKGITSLGLAAFHGHVMAVTSLLNLRADILIKDDQGCTALHVALMGGDEEVIKLLLANGSDVNAVTQNGATVLHLAALNGHEEVIKILLANGSDVNAVTENGTTALNIAAERGHEKIFEILLSKGIDIDITNKNGETALHRAVWNQKLAAVELLSKFNANFQARSLYRSSALHYAAHFGDVRILELVLSKGIDIEATEMNGETALHRAVLNRKFAAVESLLQHGANIQAKDLAGKTPLDIAREYDGDDKDDQKENEEDEEDEDGEDENEEDEDEENEDGEDEDGDEEDNEDSEGNDKDGYEDDREDDHEEHSVITQKIISLLENWDKPEQQTET